MTNESLRDEWKLRFEEFSRSEMSVADWCHANLIPIHRFYYWRKKFAPSAPAANSDGPGWLTLDVVDPGSPPAPGSGVSVRLGRTVIELSPGFDSSVLRAVVAALGPASC
jgi:hypothetical protein